MFRKLHIIFFICLSLYSCKKQHKVTIQAQDLITGDGSTYAGKSFVVVQSRPGWYEDKVKPVYEGTLDANDQASFFLKMHRDWSYILNVEQPENICYGGVVQRYLDNESNNEVVFDYLKCGFLDLKSNNINCEDIYDEFRYIYYYKSNPQIYTYKGFGTLSEWNNQVAIFGCQDYSNEYNFTKIPVGEYSVE